MDRVADDNQPTMQQRMAEKRAKLEAKLKAKRAGVVEAVHTEELDQGGLARGEEQVRASRKTINALKQQASEAVSLYRIMTDAQENERRIREEALVAAREQRTLDEASSSVRRHGSIQMKFDSLYHRSRPQELAKDIQLQQEMCDKVVKAKDQLIDELRSQMRDKEEEYVKSLKKQAEDIDKLIETMRSQTDMLVTSYNRELSTIEEAYTQERRELLENNEREIEQLVTTRMKQEREHSKRRDQRVWADQAELDRKYEENAEKHNKAKADNQHEIHGLAQELERMRSLYLLNAERLHYNLQVLRERYNENMKAINQHKRKLARLQDVLSGLITRYGEMDKRFRLTNTDLTESYRRVTTQYKDLQLKFQHFERADADRYNHIFKMHEGEGMALVHKCLQGDRCVFEEQLGVPWQPPQLDFWMEAKEEVEDVEDEEDEEEGSEQEQLGDMALAMLTGLWDQVPFLIPERVKEVVQELEAGEQEPRKVEVLLQALGITQASEVNAMMDYFVDQAEDGSATMIPPQQAVQALKRYLEDRQKTEEQNKSTKVEKKVDKGSEAQKAALRKRSELLYWERMGDVISDDHWRLWMALEGGLEKYLKALQSRSQLIEDTDQIRQQNDELRGLLNQYLSSSINDELFAPPQLQVMGANSAPQPTS